MMLSTIAFKVFFSCLFMAVITWGIGRMFSDTILGNQRVAEIYGLIVVLIIAVGGSGLIISGVAKIWGN